MANTVGPIEDVLRQALVAYLASAAAVATAIAASDDMANPTAAPMLAHGMVWDSVGSNWDRHVGAAGRALVVPINANNVGDGVNAGTFWDGGGASRAAAVGNLLSNGATYDRQRGNVEGTALISAARTATTNSGDIVNYNGRGILIMFNATAFAATPTLTISVDAKDPVSLAYLPITTFTALNIVGVTTQAYTLYPGAAETVPTANHEVQALVLPRTFRITVTHGDTDSCTYSVGYTILL